VVTGGLCQTTAQQRGTDHHELGGTPMSSRLTPMRAARPTRRLGARVVASLAGIALFGGTALATAAPANAMPRSCNDIANTVLFFEIAMDLDTGPYARFYDRDYRYWNRAIGLYYSSGC